MRKWGKDLTLSPIQTVFKLFIKFVFQVFEHPGPGYKYSHINNRTLVVVLIPTSLTDIVFWINPVFVCQNWFSTDGTFPFHQSRGLVIYPSLNNPVKIRVIDKIQILFLYPVKIP